MNERIKELYIKTLSEECSNPALVDIEKFAELIVRECVGIADEYDGAGSTIVNRIKQHFGVE
jgi:hypothetical protein